MDEITVEQMIKLISSKPDASSPIHRFIQVYDSHVGKGKIETDEQFIGSLFHLALKGLPNEKNLIKTWEKALPDTYTGSERLRWDMEQAFPHPRLVRDLASTCIEILNTFIPKQLRISQLVSAAKYLSDMDD